MSHDRGSISRWLLQEFSGVCGQRLVSPVMACPWLPLPWDGLDGRSRRVQRYQAKTVALGPKGLQGPFSMYPGGYEGDVNP